MNKIFKYSMMFAAALAFTMGFTSCSDDDNDEQDVTFSSSELKEVNADYVDNTVVATYRNLADYNKQLVADLNAMSDDAGVAKACKTWTQSRKWWEFSEAFLFGAAGDYAIDPHTDTWPFDRTQFDKYMSLYKNAKLGEEGFENETNTINEAIATGQNLTGFHAVEYLIFREGQPRHFADMTANEIYFAKTAAQDLYLSSLKLVSAWGGKVSADEQALLDEVEFASSINYGENFKNAGNAGSTYSTVVLASKEIIAGANDIIGEVRDSKIGAPATGEDVNYIESPHAHNSIQDFYDNIMSVKHALYGGCTVDGTTPEAKSLIGICLKNDKTKAAAQNVMTNLENALSKISSMKKPFVLYYTDQSAKDAMEALDGLEESLNALDKLLD
ncbi:MAG: imelysin family protein [Prevotella pectinovora]|uniref:imelysin family protein n=1 Tax=Prevotella pectinovora TaxID=1602169 RepID=UPI002599EF88|nr:imelysin family protein [Prevotella pectinovora]MDY4779697.1 imelysin family protein [Prevotella pectinovora]